MKVIPIDEIFDGAARCIGCGLNFGELKSFTMTGARTTAPTYTEEGIRCTSCDMEYALRYEWFDKSGHVGEHVFSEDPNDPTFNWFDLLTPDQRMGIQAHIQQCPVCQAREIEAHLENARFAALIHRLQGPNRRKR